MPVFERRLEVGPTTVVVRGSGRDDGDLRVDVETELLDARRRRLAPGPGTWLRQVHGRGVVTVTAPGAGAGLRADAAVTSVPGAVLSVQHADCVPVVLVGAGCLGLVHAGWRGLVAGVLDAAVEAMEALGGGRGSARLALVGACIRPHAYAFGSADLDRVVAGTDASVVAVTSDGRPAVDLARAVEVRLGRLGVDEVLDTGLDTASPDFYSHRVRGDRGRQATVAWIEPPTGSPVVASGDVP